MARKYQINEDFFDNIDSEAKAYFLGLLFADGSNIPKKCTVSISLSEKDREILEIFNEHMYITKKPLTYIVRKKAIVSKRTNKIIKAIPSYLFRIYSKHICQRLIELGCVPRKTYNCKFPRFLIEDLVKHFIRGYFDGDGHIGVYKGGKRSHRKYGHISFVCTESFAIELKKQLERILPIKCRITNSHNTMIVKELRISKKDYVLIFLDWLYKNSSIYLERKNRAYLDLKSYEKVPLKKRTSDKVCSICGGPHKGAGYCSTHYEQLVHTPRRREKRRLGLINY